MSAPERPTKLSVSPATNPCRRRTNGAGVALDSAEASVSSLNCRQSSFEFSLYPVRQECPTYSPQDGRSCPSTSYGRRQKGPLSPGRGLGQARRESAFPPRSPQSLPRGESEVGVTSRGLSAPDYFRGLPAHSGGFPAMRSPRLFPPGVGQQTGQTRGQEQKRTRFRHGGHSGGRRSDARVVIVPARSSGR